MQVARDDLEVIAEQVDEAQQRAILALCNETGRNIDGFNPSKLLPFHTSDTVVFLRFATDNAN